MGHSEQEQIRESLRHLLEGSAGPAIRDALVETGWFELLAEDAADAIRPLFGIQGELLVESSPMIHVVMSDQLPTSLHQDNLVPGMTPLLEGPLPTKGVRRWYCIGDPDALPPLVAWFRDSGLARIDGSRARAVGGMDPSLGLFEVDAPERVAETLIDGPDAERAWSLTQAACRRALSEEILGAAAAVLEMSVQYSRDRKQFGRPIGSFQAIQHELADSHIALTAARTAADTSWENPDPAIADLAKVWAGLAGRLVVKSGQQTLGGIGFTLEHPFHRFARRIHVLDALAGSSAELQRLVGRRILDGESVPRLVAL